MQSEGIKVCTRPSPLILYTQLLFYLLKAKRKKNLVTDTRSLQRRLGRRREFLVGKGISGLRGV